MKDYYHILEISQQADKQAIKSAYKRLAILYHPDKNDSPEAEEIFKLINEAYQVLSDEDKKEVYDLQFRLFNLKSYQEVNPVKKTFQRRNMAYYHERHYNRPRYIRDDQVSHNQRVRAWVIGGVIVVFFGICMGFTANLMKNNLIDKKFDEGITLMKKGDFEEADYRFNSVIGLKKNHGDAYFQKGILYAEKFHVFDQAYRCFHTAITFSEKPTAPMYFKSGFCAYKSRKFTEAIVEFTEVIDNKILPENTIQLKTEARFYRGLALQIEDATLYRSKICEDWKVASENGFSRATDSLETFCRN